MDTKKMKYPNPEDEPKRRAIASHPAIGVNPAKCLFFHKLPLENAKGRMP